MGRDAILDGITQGYPHDAQSLEIALSAMPVGVSWATLADQKIIFMNRKFTEIFGYTLEDVNNLNDWIDIAYPFEEDCSMLEAAWAPHLTGAHRDEYSIETVEVRVRCRDGKVKTILNGGVILPENGWALATFVDITDRKRDEMIILEAERQAAENQAIYRLLLDHSPEMIVLSPFDSSRRYVSSAVSHITGFTAEEYLAMKRYDTIHPDDQEEARRIIQGLRAGNLRQVLRYRTLHKSGGYRWVEASITGYLDPVSGETGGYVATIRDIADQKAREERVAADFLEISEVASLDELTGIANRRAFNRTIDAETKRHTRSTRDLSLMLIDVDHFKRYNDQYGHLAGDECLKQIATVLKTNVRRDADFPARFGGEEFVVLMPMTEIEGAELVASKILEAVSSMGMAHAGSPHRVVTVSIGIASWQAGVSLSPNLLIERADRALYQAKDGGRNRVVIG